MWSFFLIRWASLGYGEDHVSVPRTTTTDATGTSDSDMDLSGFQDHYKFSSWYMSLELLETQHFILDGFRELCTPMQDRHHLSRLPHLLR
jgi:hypothetical protein